MAYSRDYQKVRKMFWDGTSKDGTRKFKLDSDGIEHAVRRALKDYMARTDKREEDRISASEKNMFDCLKAGGFVDMIKKYFDDPPRNQAEYDKWHNKACKLFIECMNKSIKSNETYGKAQKIVNMTMKTVYCLEGAEKFADLGYFDHCHMPLDSITLDWFRCSVARDWYNESHPKELHIKISTEGGPLPKWGKIGFMDGSLKLKFSDYDTNEALRYRDEKYHYDKKYHYMFFVTMIREYFAEGNRQNVHDGLTPFQAEFYIWPEWQWKTGAKALLNEDLLKKLSANAGVCVEDPEIKGLCERLSSDMINLIGLYKM